MLSLDLVMGTTDVSLDQEFVHKVTKRLPSKLGIIRNQLVRRGQTAIETQSFVVTASKYGCFKVSATVESKYSTAAFRAIDLKPERVTLFNEYGAYNTDHGTNRIVTVSYDMKSEFAAAIARDAAYRVYIMRHKCLDNGYGLLYFNTAERYYVVLGQNKFLPADFVHKGMQAGRVRELQMFLDSPSNIRRGTALYVDVTGMSDSDAFALFNKATNGAAKIQFNIYGNILLAIKFTIKKLSRWTLTTTDSSVLGEINCFAYFKGEFKSGDGHSFMAVETIRRFFVPMNILTTNIENMTMAKQARFGLEKGFKTIGSRRALIAIMHTTIKRGEAKGIKYLPRTAEAAEDIERHPEKYDGYFIVIGGGLRDIDYLGDESTVKSVWDFSIPMDYCLMDMPVHLSGFVSTSKQVCSNMPFAKNGVQVMLKKAFATIDAILGNKNIETDPTTDDSSSSLDLQKSQYVTSDILRLIPNMVDYDATIRSQFIRTAIQSCLKTANRFNFRVQGSNVKVVPDLAAYFGKSLLRADEIYIAHPICKEGTLHVCVRHPLASIYEHKMMKTVGLELLKARIRALKISIAYQKMLIEMVTGLPSGTAMVGSTDAHLCDYFSGMDYDGDMITAISDPDIVAVYQQLPEGYVDFGSTASSDDKLRIGLESLAIAFLYAYGLWGADQTRNPAIGEIAGFLQTIKALVIGNRKGTISPVEFAKVFNGGKIGDEEYKPMFGINASFVGIEDTYCDTYIQAVKKCRFTQNDIDAFLLDLIIIGSKSINDTIDSTKNGNKVHIPFWDELKAAWRSGVVAAEDEVSFELVPGQLKLSDLVLTAVNKEHKDGEPIVLLDTMSRVRNLVAKYAYREIGKLLAKPCEYALRTYNTQDISLNQYLSWMASSYSTIMRDGANNKQICKAVLSQMIRNIGRNYAHVSDNVLFKEAASASFYGQNREHQSSFYLSLVSEAFEYYLDQYAPNAMFELPVYGFSHKRIVIGSTVTFVNGISADGYYAAHKINGTYKVLLNDAQRVVIRKAMADMIPEKNIDDSMVMMTVNVSSKNYKNAIEAYEAYVDMLEKSRIANETVSTRIYKNDRGFARVALLVNRKNADGRVQKVSTDLYLGKNDVWNDENDVRHYGSEYYMNLVGDKDINVVAIQGGVRVYKDRYGNQHTSPVLYIIGKIVNANEHTVKLNTKHVIVVDNNKNDTTVPKTSDVISAQKVTACNSNVSGTAFQVNFDSADTTIIVDNASSADDDEDMMAEAYADMDAAMAACGL